MNMQGFQVYVRDMFDQNCFEIFIAKHNEHENTITYLKTITFETDTVPISKGTEKTPIIITREMAKMLVERLWQYGIRPREAEGAIGTLRAMQDHIESLRQRDEGTLQIIKDLIELVKKTPIIDLTRTSKLHGESFITK